MAVPRFFLCSTLIALATVNVVDGHEIKAFASRMNIPEASGKSTIYLSWGHRLPVDDLVDSDSLERYDLVSPGGIAIGLKKADLSLQTNVIELKEAGIHQVLVNRKPSVYTYVFDNDGSRQLKRGPKTAVTEGKIDVGTKSIQCAKGMIVVGPGAKETIKPAGQPIEIVPLDPPMNWNENKSVRFQVLLNGKPLSFPEVNARYVGFKPDNAWCYTTTGNRDGELTIRAAHAGTWVLKVSSKQLTHGETREQYDFESYTATLSLEVLP